MRIAMPQRPAKLFTRFCLMALMFAAFATVAGYAGRLWWPLDLFSHFRLQYVFAFALIALALLVVKRWRIAVVAILGLLANGYEVARLYQADQSPAETSAAPLRLIHLNAWDWRNRDPAALARHLKTSDFDLVFIQESSAEIVEHIMALCSDFELVEPRDSYVHDQTVVFVNRHNGNSPVQITSASTRAWDGAVEVRIRWNDRDVAMLSPHVTAPGLPGSHDAREIEFASIADWANSQRGPCIVIGDINATPWSMHFRWLLAHTGLKNSQQGLGFQGSWPRRPPHSLSWIFTIPIDHCLHSDSLTTIQRSVGPDLGSDHLPIFVTLALAADRTSSHQ